MTSESERTGTTRRRFVRNGAIVASGITFGLTASGSAVASQPNFQAGFWGDGERWGTKALGELPEPMNKDSLDKLFFIPDQAPLSEAAPGNPKYNGGRWWAHTVSSEPILPERIESYKELMQFVNDPNYDITIEEGGHDPIFFECPLLPYKG